MAQGERRRRRVSAGLAVLATLTCLSGLAAALLALGPHGEAVAGGVLAPVCLPVRVLDRNGVPLAVEPAACGERGRAAWTPLSTMPQSLRDAVVAAEDHRFFAHPGVDVWAVGRALLQNLRAGRIVSGASTITMQLVRLRRHPTAQRTIAAKLHEAWLALAVERHASKEQLLEAYLNHAYFGRRAHGAAAAAERYFGKPIAALTDAEATFLAVLPRAPSAYDPITHFDRARARQLRMLASMVERNLLSPDSAAAIARVAIHVRPQPKRAQRRAPHFVDHAVGELPDRVRRAGGTLHTTLDLGLQTRLEALTAHHVAELTHRGVSEAAVVALDARSGEVRAMVGSSDYARSQLNLTTRRRHPGSLLKPFVYALALAQGRFASQRVYDIGDLPAAHGARDWAGHEGGPLAAGDALSGSYNLAALRLLQEVGAPAMHRVLKALGVAKAPQAPHRYGPAMALGATRVRLLDAVAGMGFTVRGGLVRRASSVVRVTRLPDPAYRPLDPGEHRAFSPEVAFLVADMLSQPANRHGRFGSGLPVDGPPAATRPTDLGHTPRIIAKTGTASGLSDVTAVVATERWLVGAWTGRLDGKPTRGLSGMWGAAPLAVQALHTALQGELPRLPPRPQSLVPFRVCAVSGRAADVTCPSTRTVFERPDMPLGPCPLHRGDAGPREADVPVALRPWASRARAHSDLLPLP